MQFSFHPVVGLCGVADFGYADNVHKFEDDLPNCLKKNIKFHLVDIKIEHYRLNNAVCHISILIFKILTLSLTSFQNIS